MDTEKCGVYIYTMKYYSSTKKEKLPFIMKLIDLEGFILSKISQKRKTNTV